MNSHYLRMFVCCAGSFKEMEQEIFQKKSPSPLSGARRSTAPILSPRHIGNISVGYSDLVTGGLSRIT